MNKLKTKMLLLQTVFIGSFIAYSTVIQANSSTFEEFATSVFCQGEFDDQLAFDHLTDRMLSNFHSEIDRLRSLKLSRNLPTQTIRDAIDGSTEARSKIDPEYNWDDFDRAHSDIFELTGHVFKEFILANKEKIAALALNYLSLRDVNLTFHPDLRFITFSTDEGGDLIEQQNAAIFLKSSFLLGISLVSDEIASVDAVHRVVHIGFQTVFSRSNNPTELLSHELAHLDVFASSLNTFNFLQMNVSSKQQLIPVDSYEKYFHISEVLAWVHSADAALRNAISASSQAFIGTFAKRLKSVIAIATIEKFISSVIAASSILKDVNASLAPNSISLLRISKQVISLSLKPQDIAEERVHAFSRVHIGTEPILLCPFGNIVFAYAGLNVEVPLPEQEAATIRLLIEGFHAGEVTREVVEASAIRLLNRFALVLSSQLENLLSDETLLPEFEALNSAILLLKYKIAANIPDDDKLALITRQQLEDTIKVLQRIKMRLQKRETWPP